MNTKQFVGASIDEVLRDIRAELGDEAVILHTRKVVKGGLGGFFGREMIEVTAADRLDDQAATPGPVVDVMDDGEAPGPAFSTQLSDRLTMPDPDVAPPAASAASVYARSAGPVDEPVPALGEPARPFPSANRERTRAIIEAARSAMNAADEAAVAAAPERHIPAPPAFIPTGHTDDGRAVSTPTWTRLEDAAAPAPAPAPAAPAPAAPAPAAPAPAAPAPAAAAPAPAPMPVPVPAPAPPAASRADLAAALEAARARVAASAAALVQAPPPELDDAPEAAPARAEAAAATAPLPVPAPLPAVAAPADAAPTAPAPAPAPPVLTVVPDPVDAPEAPETDFSHPEVDALRDELAEAGVDPRYLDPFVDGFRRNAVPFLADDADVREGVRQALAARLPVSRDWKGRPKGQALAFVGQCGVGKSTVVRKLAWRLHQAGRDVTIIAAGDEPDASVASLAERLGLTYVHAADAESLAQARTAAADAEADIVLIDTPGRSHTNLDEMEELGRLLSLARVEEVHLVMPVAVPLADLGDLSRRFRIAGVNRLTLTKLDETRVLGNLVNVPLRLSKPLAFLADGTSATSHLRPVDPHFVAGVLLP